MFTELHLLQSFAPSCLNRDDTNNPKDCQFGGQRRARISSQCLKRAIRQSEAFAKVAGDKTGRRSKLLPKQLRERLEERGHPKEEVELVVASFAQSYAAGLDPKDPNRTKVLLYLAQSEVGDMAQALDTGWATLLAEAEAAEAAEEGKGRKAKKGASPTMAATVKELIQAHEKRTDALDIALFGRMLAQNPALNLDAACQVAHAISTHRVAMEMDFYTAVDDLQPTEESGAGMMGFVNFDSACFYRYARLDHKQLLLNLQEDVALARLATEAFLRGAVTAVPSARQNSMAAHNPPSLALAVVREGGMGWSLTNAFEAPVRAPRDGGYVSASIDALNTYWGQLYDLYGCDDIVAAHAVVLEPDVELHDTIQRQPNLKAFIEATLEKGWPAEGGDG